MLFYTQSQHTLNAPKETSFDIQGKQRAKRLFSTFSNQLHFFLFFICSFDFVFYSLPNRSSLNPRARIYVVAELRSGERLGNMSILALEVRVSS